MATNVRDQNLTRTFAEAKVLQRSRALGSGGAVKRVDDESRFAAITRVEQPIEKHDGDDTFVVMLDDGSPILARMPLLVLRDVASFKLGDLCVLAHVYLEKKNTVVVSVRRYDERDNALAETVRLSVHDIKAASEDDCQHPDRTRKRLIRELADHATPPVTGERVNGTTPANARPDAAAPNLQPPLFPLDDYERILNANAYERKLTGTIYSDRAVIESTFQWFRAHGFPYRDLPLHVCMQQIDALACTQREASLSVTNLGYQVADTYHKHRMHSSAEDMRSPYASFCDDDTLRAAITKELHGGYAGPEVKTEGRVGRQGKVGTSFFAMLNLVQGTQACANFRPGFALLLYRRFCKPGMTVLDTSTGYGGRLVGFMASGFAGTYIGIDPNTLTHNANVAMATDMGFGDNIELYNQPAEDVYRDYVDELRGRCDFAFTSPPYFTKEHYSEEDTQSWKRYPEAEDWRKGFLRPMLDLTFAALKPGAFAILNINEVILKGYRYPLDDWTKMCATDAGFIYHTTELFSVHRVVGRKAEGTGERRSEPVLIFQKPY